MLSLVRSEPRRAEAALEDLADLFRVLMRDNRDLAPLADEVELCRQYLELEQLRLGDRLADRLEREEHAGRRARAAAGAAAAARERRLSRHRAVDRARRRVDQHLPVARRSARDPASNPYVANGARHHVGNKMALDNIRERLALHFDAEASLESRVTRDSYEVHIRMPYRTAEARAGGNGADDAPRGTHASTIAARTSGANRAAPAASRARPQRGSNHG